MKPTFEKPNWATPDWKDKAEKASEHLTKKHVINPAYCGNKLIELFPDEGRLFKDLALILLGSDWPSCIGLVQELTVIFSEKCECKECVFHEILTNN